MPTETDRINSVYLTGWEYNRFLSRDPTQPRNSALPTAILWKGAHQLWMFEHIYVTKEASANESYATQELGWLMGDVLDFLRDEDDAPLRIIDWALLPLELKQRLAKIREAEVQRLHSDVCSARSFADTPDVTVEDVAHALVVGAIRQGAWTHLEHLKHLLLQPIMDRFGCLASGLPTNLDAWIHTTGNAVPAPALELELLRRIAQPVIPGLLACRSPATMGSAFERQQLVMAREEAPRIVDPIAGIGDFSDPSEGYRPYVDALKPHRAEYDEVNDGMRED